MPINRNAAMAYAKRYWNRVTDDDIFWIEGAAVKLVDKRKAMNAPANDGWEALFVPDGTNHEKAVFRRKKPDGQMEEKLVAIWDDLDDCTHYVCRCLLTEGVSLEVTPKATALTEAMLKSKQAKTLAEIVTRKEGQKVVDSGIFRPGDLVAYYTDKKGRYMHTGMFVGNQSGATSDPGGITCHTKCKFEGLTKDWNGSSEDAWFLHDGFWYTLIHFSEDDPAIPDTTLKWLVGWWKIGMGNEFYYVSESGDAFSTDLEPKSPSDKLQNGKSVGCFFYVDGDIVFVWRTQVKRYRNVEKLKKELIHVECWRPPFGHAKPTLYRDGDLLSLEKVF